MTPSFTKSLRVLMFADAAGYSRLCGVNEDQAHTALTDGFALFTDVIAEYGGHAVYFPGDAVLAEFPSAAAAIDCALTIQERAAIEFAASDERHALQFRIAINAGDVIIDRDNLYGDCVNVCERLQGVAQPGQVLLSSAVVELVGAQDRFDFTHAGDFKVKNIARRVSGFTASRSAQGADRIDISDREKALQQVVALCLHLRNLSTLFASVGIEEFDSAIDALTGEVYDRAGDLGGRVLQSGPDCLQVIFAERPGGTEPAVRAVECALRIRSQARARAFGGQAIQIGIGLDYGPAIVTMRAGRLIANGAPLLRASTIANNQATDDIVMTDPLRASLRDRCPVEEIDMAGQSSGLPKLWRVTQSRIPVQRPAMVGRKRELQQARFLIDSVLADGLGSLLILQGEAGIGKTRLLHEIVAEAHAKGFECHVGEIFDFGHIDRNDTETALLSRLLDLPVSSGADLLRDALLRVEGMNELEPAQICALYEAFDSPMPARLEAFFRSLDIAVRQQHRRTLLAQICQQRALRTPLLIAVEDLHWASPDLRDILAALAATIAEQPILLVLTGRNGDGPGSWRGTFDDSDPLAITLGPLRESDCRALAGGHRDKSSIAVDSLILRARGNPFFLEQLLENSSDHNSELPVTIAAVLRRGLDALPVAAREALQVASIGGSRIGRDLLRHLLASPDLDVAILTDTGYVAADETSLFFTHALIREAAYGSILPKHRHELHRRAAEWFDGSDLVLRAEHLDKADDRRTAIAYLDAAKADDAALRHARALQLVDRGLMLARGNEETFELRRIRGQILFNLGANMEAQVEWQKSLSFAGSEFERASVWLALAESKCLADAYQEAIAYLDLAESAIGRAGSSRQLARLNTLRGSIYFPLGRIEECLEAQNKAYDLARRSGDPELRAKALSGLGDAEYARGRMMTAHKKFVESVDVGRINGLGMIVVNNQHMVAASSHYFRPLREAFDSGTLALKIASEALQYRAQICAHSTLSVIAFDRGDLNAATRHAQSCADLATHIRAVRFLPLSLLIRAKVARYRDDTATARSLIAEALTLSRKVGRSYNGARLYAEAALLEAIPAKARHWLHRGEALLKRGAISSDHLWFYRDAIEASLRLGDQDETRRFCDALRDFTASEPLLWAEICIRRGLLLADSGNGASDPAALREDWAALRADGHAYGIAEPLMAGALDNPAISFPITIQLIDCTWQTGKLASAARH